MVLFVSFRTGPHTFLGAKVCKGDWYKTNNEERIWLWKVTWQEMVWCNVIPQNLWQKVKRTKGLKSKVWKGVRSKSKNVRKCFKNADFWEKKNEFSRSYSFFFSLTEFYPSVPKPSLKTFLLSLIHLQVQPCTKPHLAKMDRTNGCLRLFHVGMQHAIPRTGSKRKRNECRYDGVSLPMTDSPRKRLHTG